MKNYTPTALAVTLIVLFSSCEKESEPNFQSSTSLKSGTTLTDEASLPEDFPYEVYSPEDTTNLDSIFESEVLYAFDDQNAVETTPVNKAIWIMEGCMNKFFTDSLLMDYDSIVEITRSYTFELNSSDEISLEDLKSNFSDEYAQIDDDKSNNSSYSHIITDIRLDKLTSGASAEISFTSHYQINQSGPWPAWYYSVPPSGNDRYAGISAVCGAMSGYGAWQKITDQARVTIPPYSGNSNYWGNRTITNVMIVNSDPGSKGVTIVPGKWMLGRANALISSHQNGVTIQTCILASEQDTYAQRLVNEILDVEAKRYYWDGTRSISVNSSSQGSSVSVTRYYYNYSLGKYFPSKATITPASLGI